MKRHPLYDLLPAYIRFRDQQGNANLRTFFEGLERPFEEIEENLGTLYNAWFIETCDDWMVPYLGDLIGVRGLERERWATLPGQRSRVGNTIAYRRRKGTGAALERLAQDVTGWPCHLIEYRKLISTTQFLGSVRPQRGRTVDLRQLDEDSWLRPGSELAHNADFKPIETVRPPLNTPGGFNLPNLGLIFWRLPSYAVWNSAPRRATPPVEEARYSCFTFDPFGNDVPLVRQPKTLEHHVQSNLPENVPLALTRRSLEIELAQFPTGIPFQSTPALDIRILLPNDSPLGWYPVPTSAIKVGDLSSWALDAIDTPWVEGQDGDTVTNKDPKVIVDPELGRFVVIPAQPKSLRVDYSYAFSSDIGGGAYPRQLNPVSEEPGRWLAMVQPRPTDFQSEADPTDTVSEERNDTAEQQNIIDGVWQFYSLREALESWNRTASSPIPDAQDRPFIPQDGTITICHSEFLEDGKSLEGGEFLEDPSEAIEIELNHRHLIIQGGDGYRPFFANDFIVYGRQDLTGGAVQTSSDNDTSRLSLDGLWIDGTLHVETPMTLELEHCTVHPTRQESPAASIMACPASYRGLILKVHSCLMGSLQLPSHGIRLEVSDSIIDHQAIDQVLAPGPKAQLARTTWLGSSTFHQLSASSVIFDGQIDVKDHHVGSLHFCYLPAGSKAPHQFDCIEGLPPDFVSTTFGQPSYGQLSPHCSLEILTGGGDGNEIGVFQNLRQQDRLAALWEILERHAPVESTPRISFAT